MQKNIIGIAIIFAVALSVVLYAISKDIVVSNDSSQKIESVELTVLAQTADTSVRIESVILSSSGFIAIRTVEGSRMGQIVEISPYLLSGEHTNITIELGEFYDGTSELVAVVYQDDKNDMTFNDFDQPMRDTRGDVIARYVKTGEKASSALFTNMGEDMPHMMGEMKMETVRYTNAGYEPPSLSVPVGTMVQFVNESDDEMWVASNEHPAHTDLPTFDQFGLSPKGSTYMYTFDKEGVWAYHDHLNPEREGVVEVN